MNKPITAAERTDIQRCISFLAKIEQDAHDAKVHLQEALSRNEIPTTNAFKVIGALNVVYVLGSKNLQTISKTLQRTLL